MPVWLLFLSIALVQLVLGVLGIRSALVVVAASVLWVVARANLLTDAGGATFSARVLDTGLVVGGYLLATGAMMVAHRRSARTQARLRELAERDPGTGCLNRRGLARQLEVLVRDARALPRDVALLALDLDHFKQINDRHGHLIGDAVLSDVGAALVETVAGSGWVARLGGEEFAILLTSADAEVAGAMAERLRTRVRELPLRSVGVNDVRVTTSIGIAAEHLRRPNDVAALRARADEALYAAKRSGRDRALLWAPGVRSHTTPVVPLPPIDADHRRTVAPLSA